MAKRKPRIEKQAPKNASVLSNPRYEDAREMLRRLGYTPMTRVPDSIGRRGRSNGDYSRTGFMWHVLGWSGLG